MEIGIKYETVVMHEIIDRLITESGHHGCVRKIVVCTCIYNCEICKIVVCTCIYNCEICELLNSHGEKFHQYQQNEQLPHNYIIKHK
jgi:hypothetical protein